MRIYNQRKESQRINEALGAIPGLNLCKEIHPDQEKDSDTAANEERIHHGGLDTVQPAGEPEPKTALITAPGAVERPRN